MKVGGGMKKFFGFELIMADDIDEIGTGDIKRQIRERVGNSPVYLRYVLGE